MVNSAEQNHSKLCDPRPDLDCGLHEVPRMQIASRADDVPCSAGLVAAKRALACPDPEATQMKKNGHPKEPNRPSPTSGG